MDTPVELFAILIGVACVIVAVGLAKKLGVALAIGGMFILMIGLVTDNIILGQVPQSSTTSGATTTYLMVDNPFPLESWHKVLLSLLGIFLCLLGGILSFKESGS